MNVQALAAAYLDHARLYYRKPKSRRVTSEVALIRSALQALEAVGGCVPADEADAALIASARRWLLEHTDNARRTINAKVSRMVRMFAWAADPEQGYVSALTLAKVKSVRPLKYGRSGARETDGLGPVDRQQVMDLLASLFEPLADGRKVSRSIVRSRQRLATMIELQLESGMRPGELCSMRREDLTREGDVWLYEPREHKTEHRGRKRVIVIYGPAAAILSRWMTQRRIVGKGAVFGMRPAGYRQAIQRQLERAGLPAWTPHQLRHTMATEKRVEFGLDVVQALLGHASIRTTERYAGQDMRAVIAKLTGGASLAG
jgi:integrase